MSQKELLDVVKGVEIIFAQALVKSNGQTLFDILSDRGFFTIQDENLDTLEVDKLTFIGWILDRKKDVESLVYYFDQCTFCKIGNPVVIFNNGSFPKKPKDNSEKEKAGLMFVIEDEKIKRIDFCYSFLESDNRYVFEKNIEDKLNKYMTIKNCTMEQAKQDFRDNPFIFCDITN
jgi:hypothetical protein